MSTCNCHVDSEVNFSYTKKVHFKVIEEKYKYVSYKGQNKL